MDGQNHLLNSILPVECTQTDPSERCHMTSRIELQLSIEESGNLTSREESGNVNQQEDCMEFATISKGNIYTSNETQDPEDFINIRKMKNALHQRKRGLSPLKELHSKEEINQGSAGSSPHAYSYPQSANGTNDLEDDNIVPFEKQLTETDVLTREHHILRRQSPYIYEDNIYRNPETGVLKVSTYCSLEKDAVDPSNSLPLICTLESLCTEDETVQESTGYIPPPQAHLLSAEEPNGQEVISFVPCEKQSKVVLIGEHQILNKECSDISVENIYESPETDVPQCCTEFSLEKDDIDLSKSLSLPHRQDVDQFEMLYKKEETVQGSDDHILPPQAHMLSADEANGLEADSLVAFEKQSTDVWSGHHQTSQILKVDSSNISKLNVCSNPETKFSECDNISNVAVDANLNPLVSLPLKELVGPLGTWSTKQETTQGSTGEVQNSQLHLLSAEGTNDIDMDSLLSCEKQLAKVLTGDQQEKKKKKRKRQRKTPKTKDQNFFLQCRLGLFSVVMSILKWFDNYLNSATTLTKATPEKLILICICFCLVIPVSADIKSCKRSLTSNSGFEMPFIIKNQSLSDICILNKLPVYLNEVTCQNNLSLYFTNKSSFTLLFPETFLQTLFIEFTENGKGARMVLQLSKADCKKNPDRIPEAKETALKTVVGTADPPRTSELAHVTRDNRRPPDDGPSKWTSGDTVAILVLIGFAAILPLWYYKKRILQCIAIQRNRQRNNSRSSVPLNPAQSTENDAREPLNNDAMEMVRSDKVNTQLLGTEQNGGCKVIVESDDQWTPNGHTLPTPSPRDDITKL